MPVMCGVLGEVFIKEDKAAGRGDPPRITALYPRWSPGLHMLRVERTPSPSGGGRPATSPASGFAFYMTLLPLVFSRSLSGKLYDPLVLFFTEIGLLFSL